MSFQLPYHCGAITNFSADYSHLCSQSICKACANPLTSTHELIEKAKLLCHCRGVNFLAAAENSLLSELYSREILVGVPFSGSSQV